MRYRRFSGRIAKKGLGAILLVFFLVPCVAGAELDVSAGAEYLKWKETANPAIEETGPMLALGLGYTQDKDSGLVLGYRGKLWTGTVNHEGATQFGNTPASGETDYAGFGNELQFRLRKTGDDGGRLDTLLGAGFEMWRRRLPTVQSEDYQVAYLRLGVESGAAAAGKWSVGLGLKYPVWTRVNAHLDQIGFDSNPAFAPGNAISAYVSIGYRIAERMQVVAYYDSFSFKRSDDVHTTAVGLGIGQATLYLPASTLSVIGLKLEYRVR